MSSVHVTKVSGCWKRIEESSILLIPFTICVDDLILNENFNYITYQACKSKFLLRTIDLSAILCQKRLTLNFFRKVIFRVRGE